MRNFSYRIACSTDSVSSRKELEAFSSALISEIKTTRKSDQYDIRVDRIDGLRLSQETNARHEAHELSGGDSPVVVTDAGSAIAYANGCTSIIASYDFFEDVEHLSRVTDIPPDRLRNRLHAALNQADRVVIVGEEAQQLTWSHCPRDCHYVQLPPLVLYDSPANRPDGTPLVVVHDSKEKPVADNICEMFLTRFGAANVVIANADIDTIETTGSQLKQGVLRSGIGIAVHLGRDTTNRPGMRLVDCWASGVPVVQYFAGPAVHGADPTEGLLGDNEDGLLSTTLPKLCSDIELLMSDPVLTGVFARNAKTKIAGARSLWLEIIQQGLFGEQQ